MGPRTDQPSVQSVQQQAQRLVRAAAPKHWGTLDLAKTNQCECEVGAATRAHRGGDIVMIGIKPLYISICVSLVFLACYFGLCNGVFQFFPKPVFTHWSWKPLFKGCATRGASSFYPMRARANSGQLYITLRVYCKGCISTLNYKYQY